MFTGSFCGSFQHTLDDKNRFKVPAAFREGLGSRVYIIKSPDSATKCLFIYSEEGWSELYAQFDNGEVHDQNERRKTRKILSGVVCGEVDKGGRVTLNAGLKEYAGVKDEVFIVGNHRHVELWSLEEWDKENAEMEEISTDELNIKF